MTLAGHPLPGRSVQFLIGLALLALIMTTLVVIAR
jgi:hypothetical protein